MLIEQKQAYTSNTFIQYTRNFKKLFNTFSLWCWTLYSLSPCDFRHCFMNGTILMQICPLALDVGWSWNIL